MSYEQSTNVNFLGESSLSPLHEDALTAPIQATFSPEEAEEIFANIMQESFDTVLVGWTNKTIALNVFGHVLSGLSSYVYWDSSLKAGADFASQMPGSWKPPVLSVQIPLLLGAMISNYVLNAYCGVSIPEKIEAAVKSDGKLYEKSTVVSRMNFDGVSLSPAEKNRYLAGKVVKNTLLGTVVALSTTQNLALGAESEPFWLLAAQFVGFFMMHWDSVAHFVAQGVDKLGQTEEDKENQALLDKFRGESSNALYTLRLYADELSKNPEFQQILNQFKANNTEKVKALALYLQILQLSEQLRTTHDIQPKIKFDPKIALAINTASALGLLSVYMGYNYAVYQFLDGFVPSLPVWSKVALTFALTSVLNYWMAVPINVGNNKVLLDYFATPSHLQEKSIAYQKYPAVFTAISGTLYLAALLSFASTVRLNQTFYGTGALGTSINVLAIFLNASFNAFPVPMVAGDLTLAFAAVFLSGWSKESQDYYAKTAVFAKLERFLQNFNATAKLFFPNQFVKKFEICTKQESAVCDLESGVVPEKPSWGSYASSFFASNRSMTPVTASSSDMSLGNSESSMGPRDSGL